MNFKARSLDPSQATPLLSVTQQLRIHWAQGVMTWAGTFLIMLTAVWSWYLKAYLDLQIAGKPGGEAMLSQAAGLSVLLLSTWRLYTHFMDNSICGLYADLVLLEGALGSPPQAGTRGYLMRTTPTLQPLLATSNLASAVMSELVRSLVQQRRIGDRGHAWIDCFVAAAILGCWVAVLWLHPRGQITSVIPASVGTALFVFALSRAQWNPSRRLIGALVRAAAPEQAGQ